MQAQLDTLQKQIRNIEEWIFKKDRQQISFPIDQTSLKIINENNNKIAIGGIYLSITGVNPATEIGYGTWTQVAVNQVLRGTTGASGGTGSNVGITTGVSTYLINVWLRQS